MYVLNLKKNVICNDICILMFNQNKQYVKLQHPPHDLTGPRHHSLQHPPHDLTGPRHHSLQHPPHDLTGPRHYSLHHLPHDLTGPRHHLLQLIIFSIILIFSEL